MCRLRHSYFYAATPEPNLAVLAAYLVVQCMTCHNMPQNTLLQVQNPTTSHLRHPFTAVKDSVTKSPGQSSTAFVHCGWSVLGEQTLDVAPAAAQLRCIPGCTAAPPALHKGPLLRSLGLNPCVVGQRTWQCSCMIKGIQQEQNGKKAMVRSVCVIVPYRGRVRGGQFVTSREKSAARSA